MKIKLEAEMKQGVSKKTGAPFEYLCLHFPNGYDKMVFLQFSEKFMINSLIDDAQRQNKA